MITLKSETQLIQKLNRLKDFIGNTPLFPIVKLSPNTDVKIYAKLEWHQLGGSVKARPAFNIILDAVEKGYLTPGKTLLDASSGNTAIAYAAVGSALGIPVTICLPENASEERKQALKAYNTDIVYTSKFGSTDEAQEIAIGLAEGKPDKYFYANQYGNENNWKAHYYGTGEEIWKQTKGKITHFVTGLGTTGSFMGTGRRLKEHNKDVQLIALQPETALHGLEGWKHLESAFVPSIYDQSFADQKLEIDTGEAYEYIKKAAGEEGLILSPSAAANLAGAIHLAETIDHGVIVTLFPDNGEKYGEVLKSLYQNEA